MSSTYPYCCLVPVETVGLLVGRGGSTIRQIQQDSGATISISTEQDTPQALSDRVVAVQGETSAKAKAFQEILVRLFRTQEVEEGDCGVFVLVVPSSAIGFIIGPKGATITGIMEATNADISISRSCIDGTDLQPISISGDLPQALAAAMQIGSHLESLAENGRLEGVMWPPRCVNREQRSSLGARSRSITPGMRSAQTDSASSGGHGARSRSTTPPVAVHRRPSPQAAMPPSFASRSENRNGQEATSGGYEQRRTREEVSSTSKSPAPGNRASRQISPRLASQESCMSFLVDAPVAAWIVGKRGSVIEELRAKSGASIEVEKHGGATRSVELKGTSEAIKIAIDLLVDCIHSFPAGAPTDMKIKVPFGVSDDSVSKTLRDITSLTAETVALIGGLNERVVRLQGSRQSITQACHDLSVIFTGTCTNTSHLGRRALEGDHQISRPNSDMDCSGTRHQIGVVSKHKPNESRLLKVGSFLEARSQAVGPVGQTPSEAHLLKVLMSGSIPNQAQLRIVLPRHFVRSVLIEQGREAIVSERSGSSLDLGREGIDDVGSQIVTLTGQMLGNSMAALYIQELLMQYT